MFTQGKDVALFIGDTVVVSDEGAANILTPSKKKIKNIAIFLKDADSSAEEEVPETLPDPDSFGRGRRTAVLDQKLRQEEYTRKQNPSRYHDRFYAIASQTFRTVRVRRTR